MSSALSWQGRAPTKCMQLRQLLKDGTWHRADEIREVAGWRFSARLMELRTGEDGDAPLVIEKRSVKGDVVWEYRSLGEAEAPQQTRSNAAIYAELRRHIAELEREVARLRAELGSPR
jgi:hypothetical protein